MLISVMCLLSGQLSGEIVGVAQCEVRQRSMSVQGQTRLSTVAIRMSVPGKKRTSPIFVQNSIHRMSGFRGRADLIQERRDFRYVPTSDIQVVTGLTY